VFDDVVKGLDVTVKGLAASRLKTVLDDVVNLYDACTFEVSERTKKV